MSSIDDFEIPPALLQQLTTDVAQAKAGALLTLAKVVPSLGRGFRLTAANSKFIQQRLTTRLAESGALGDEIRNFLAQEGLNGQLVLVLSAIPLLACLPSLLAIFGRERLLAALLVDSRPEVRRIAVDYCQGDDWQTRPLPERQAAIALMSESLSPFLSAIAPLVDASRPDAELAAREDEGRRAEVSGLRRKVTDLEERLQRVRDERKADKKVDAKIEAGKRQLAEQEEKLNRERQGRLNVEAALSQANARIDDLRAAHDGAVRAGVQAEMQAVTRRWLQEPLRIGQAVDDLARQPGADILARVKAALAGQEERDRHYGNRVRLRSRLQDLQQAEASLLQAATEAINPLPELAGLMAEVQAEAARLAAILGEPRPLSQVTERFAATIRQAADQDELVRISRLLQELEGLGCLCPAEIRTLYQEYDLCLGRLFDRFAPQALPVAASSDPALTVHHGLAKEDRFLWLLDGYNILFALADLFAGDFEDGRPAAQARHRLLSMVHALLAGTEGHADVFFDGEISGQENFSPQVKVVYSGGGGVTVRNRADEAMVAWLENQLPGGMACPCVVVTNDRELGARCQALGAWVMPVQHFAAAFLLRQKG